MHKIEAIFPDNEVPLLTVKDLTISFKIYAGEVQALRSINFDVQRGESLAIVGESACGKSVTAQAIMGLIPQPPGIIHSGKISLNGKALDQLSDQEMESVRGKDISMIFQDPMSSLNPTMTIGKQIAEVLIHHQGMSFMEARENVIKILEQVHISKPHRRFDQYPFELSGGMRQRVMIAIAIACKPKLLIADEPTTALDVTIQAEILDLLKDLKKKLNMSIILITHDLGVVAGNCDRVLVMYGGEVMEVACVDDIFSRTSHPYTQALLRAIPHSNMSKSQALYPIHGTPPDLIKPPIGCPFTSRCRFSMEVCQKMKPHFFEDSPSHHSKCWLHHPHARERLKSFFSSKKGN